MERSDCWNVKLQMVEADIIERLNLANHRLTQFELAMKVRESGVLAEKEIYALTTLRTMVSVLLVEYSNFIYENQHVREKNYWDRPVDRFAHK